MIRRRDFLRMTVVSAAAAASSQLQACAAPEDPAAVFPQGIASGDPRATSVVLWTRVQPKDGAKEDVYFELAEDEAFRKVVASGWVEATEPADHTCRIKVANLNAATRYFYRFSARRTLSPVGRTKTAPAEDADVPVRFAFTTCQDYVGRYFLPWRILADEPAVDFVLFLGDYIYETTRTPVARVPTRERQVSLPDGLELGPTPGDGRAAITLGDFRALYRTYRGDKDLQRVHALFPFIPIWDDHEFGNDCWQDRTNHFDGKQGDEVRREAREAATRAWFEYLPVDLELRAGVPFPDDIQIYRALRFGKHVELFLTDQRYYRDDHLIAEGPVDPEVGKSMENTIFGSRTFTLKDPVDVREASKRPSMLGAAQRDWLISSMKGSTATWKVMGSQTMFAQLVVDLRDRTDVAQQIRNRYYFKLDQWDGYRSERRQILSELAATPNVVVLSGDLHASYAAELRPDFDAPGAATATEYMCPSISAVSLTEQLEAAVVVEPVLEVAGLDKVIADADALIAKSNPHLRYVKNKTYGIAIAEVDADKELRVDFIEIADTKVSEVGAVARTRFRTPAGTAVVERVA